MNFHHFFRTGYRNGAGFTLIEIAVMILVAAIILPTLILPFVEGVSELDQPMIMTTLTFLAQEEMETRVICRTYDTVAGWASTAIDGFPDYTSECAIDDTVTFGPVVAGVRKITLRVTYNDPELDPDPFLELVTVKTDWGAPMPPP
ncbi:MAG: hypothetical protein RAO92_04085 [Candidatus Euphemobacter frigidus]|nr:hypothetical protein [Candidatus Euphemobacter frigidus]MDP8275564.1 hypothetical protein [Candidatus Euphemobacter frigidus]